jgi:predicted dithiol-disulfide oxidoreductase (DUF899 family)
MVEIEAFKKRMGWKFHWVSSFESDFNFDYQVSFTPEDKEKGQVEYNYSQTKYFSEEGPGLSAFAKEDGAIFHTYSTFARGLDILLGAYNFMDMSPKGRDEGELPFSMAWVRHHDRYDQGYFVDPKAALVEPAQVSHACCSGEAEA